MFGAGKVHLATAAGAWYLTVSGALQCRLQAVVQTLSEAASSIGVFSNSRAAAYWGYHITRSSFFALQGIAGALPACRGALPPH